MAQSIHRPGWSAFKTAILFAVAAWGLQVASLTSADASVSCAAVNAGAFNLTSPASSPGNTALLFNWHIGDKITLNIVDAVGFSHNDGFFHGATFANGVFGPLEQVSVPANGNTTTSHTVVSADVTNGIALDPENSDSVTATCVAKTATTLVASPNPSLYRQTVTLTATVTVGGPAATGMVTFQDGATALGSAALASGVAVLSTNQLDVGGHSITAVYGGDTGFAPSTSSAVGATVNKGATSVSLGAAPNPSTFGQSVTFTATVTATAPASGKPAGTVTFSDGAVTLGSSAFSAGVATFSISSLGGGAHSIVAVYGGNGKFNGSTSPTFSQQVNAATTSVVVTSSLNPSPHGQSVTFTATVTSGGGTPTGAVTFMDGGTAIGSRNLSGGAASIAKAGLAVGVHAITAAYLGNANFAAATSAAVLQTVNPAPKDKPAASDPARTGPNGHLTVLYSFSGGGDDGALPAAGVVMGPDGSLYGTTSSGGGSSNCRSGCGAVFRLEPPAPGKARWTATVLHRFSGGDGSRPLAGLIADHDGALYGTTSEGGASNLGTAFKLAPTDGRAKRWKMTVLHSFAGGAAEGSRPLAGLIADRDGALYGTTSEGGAAALGTVFRLTPPGAGDQPWTHALLHSFQGGRYDGARPVGGVIVARDGALLGTTMNGGGTLGCEAGCGTIFELRPAASETKPWTLAVLYRLRGTAADGAAPQAALLADKHGALYGTTSAGGSTIECAGNAGGCGTAFTLTPPGAGANSWREASLFRFPANGKHGFRPLAGLVMDRAGNVYGTTTDGAGSGACGSSCGTVFELKPPAAGQNGWRQIVLHRFAGGDDDGIGPVGNLIVGPDGALYGTARRGGASNRGIVYKLTH